VRVRVSPFAPYFIKYIGIRNFKIVPIILIKHH
jgi:hypothetical protein